MSRVLNHSGFARVSSWLAIVILSQAVLCSSANALAPSITLSKKMGPPTSNIVVSGSGFGARAQVDIYFDMTIEALVVTDANGAFGGTAIQAPRSAHPGEHWVRALERKSNQSAKDPFLVNTNWPQFLYDNAHSGLNPYENSLNTKTVSLLTLKWTVPNNNAGSSAAVVDGVLYDGISGAMSARSATTGVLQWTYQTSPGAIYTSPTVTNNVVYFGTDSGYVYAIDAREGTLLWSYLTPSLVHSSLTLADGMVYFGSWDGTFFALSADTGAPVWTFTAGKTIESTPAVVNGKVYFGSDDGNLYVLDQNTGSLLWQYAALSYVASAPAVANGMVYFGSYDGFLYALDADNGSFRWKFPTGQIVYSSPAVANGIVYLAGWDGELYAVSASTGELLWQRFVSASINSPALANGVVYIATQNSMDALDALTGDFLWGHSISGHNGSSAAVTNGTIYLNSLLNIYVFGLPGAGSGTR